jgi:hypothetical protein
LSPAPAEPRPLAEVTRGELARGTPEFGIPDWRDAPPLRLMQRNQA